MYFSLTKNKYISAKPISLIARLYEMEENTLYQRYKQKTIIDQGCTQKFNNDKSNFIELWIKHLEERYYRK